MGRHIVVLALAAALAFAAACERLKQAQPPAKGAPAPETTQAPAAADGKVPLSCNSEAAAAFKRGQELMENFRVAEATDQLQQTMKQDPACARAYAWLALAVPSSEVPAHLERALLLARQLPEAERLDIKSISTYL